MRVGLLSGFRALDLTDDKGADCGRFLSTLGVDVIKIETISGDQGRAQPPCVESSSGSVSISWLAKNSGKRGVTLDLDAESGRHELLRLVSASDFVIESFQPGYLAQRQVDFERLRAANPAIILTSITHFGQTGPYSQYAGSELVDVALSGILRDMGQPDRPPVMEAPGSGYYATSLAAALGTVLAHYHRQQTGIGQHVDVSVQEVNAARLGIGQVVWQFDRRLIHRNAPFTQFSTGEVRSVWPCKDGYVRWGLYPGAAHARATQSLAQWLADEGDDTLMAVRDWRQFDAAAVQPETLQEFETAIGRFFLRHDKRQLTEEGGRRDIHAAVINDVGDLLTGAHLRDRTFWQPLGFEQLGLTLDYPRYFVVSNETDNTLVRPAPELGQHNAEILGTEFAGRLGAIEIAKSNPPLAAATRQALAGVKVLDFGWALNGALCSKQLANHGATVVRIESLARVDGPRLTRQVSNSSAESLDDKPWFVYLNTSKLSMQLDLKHPRAREVLDRLVAWADIVNANFTPGTLDKLGLGYDSLRQINPGIVVLEASVFGQTGPLAAEWGIDSTANAWSARQGLQGWPDREPASPTTASFGDELLPLVSATAIVSALDYRRRTGRGQYLDTSMLEILAQQLTPQLLAFQINDEIPIRTGNRVAWAAPHGVFPCAGEDQWCAVAVTSDAEWNALVTTVLQPWTSDERFATLEGRKRNEDELEQLFSEWTRARSAKEVMQALQQGGIAAGVVQDASQIVDHDLQLRHRGMLTSMPHPVLGTFGHPTPPYKLLGTPAQVRSAPLFGEHTRMVCTKLLGMSAEEIAELERAAVFR